MDLIARVGIEMLGGLGGCGLSGRPHGVCKCYCVDVLSWSLRSDENAWSVREVGFSGRAGIFGLMSQRSKVDAAIKSSTMQQPRLTSIIGDALIHECIYTKYTKFPKCDMFVYPNL